MPDGRYELKSFATDADRNSVCAYGVFSATHTGQGGPCPPTGKSTTTDYVYVANIGAGTISIFSLNTSSGLLGVVGQPIVIFGQTSAVGGKF